MTSAMTSTMTSVFTFAAKTATWYGLRAVSFFASKDKARPALTGAILDVDPNGQWRVTATDSYVMASFSTGHLVPSHIPGDFKCLLPPEMFKAVWAVKRGDITVAHNDLDQTVHIVDGQTGASTVMPLIQGEPVNYSKFFANFPYKTEQHVLHCLAPDRLMDIARAGSALDAAMEFHTHPEDGSESSALKPIEVRFRSNVSNPEQRAAAENIQALVMPVRITS